MIYNTTKDKIEDWFLELSFIKDKWPQEVYFTWCRLLDKIEDIIWYGPKLFIKNIWIYKKILWSNNWFDSYFLLEIIKTKLDYDATQYKKNGNSVNSVNYAKEMEYCSLLLKRLINDTYEDEHLKYHNIKWGELNTSTVPSKTHPKCIKLIFSRKNIITDKQKKQESKEYIQHIQDAWDEKQVDTEKLFDFMKKNIYNWWD